APVPGEQRGGELGVADGDADRHLAPVDKAAGCLLKILAFLRRHGHEEVRRRSAPLDHLTSEGPLHVPDHRRYAHAWGTRSIPEVCQSHGRTHSHAAGRALSSMRFIWRW